ncbi:MAG TPA: M23 family metallopeptidase, partial [Symbiobacteriaceae bacterium]|nr:M23 family metallopeptidase [Symbiobacteriaceae bacterium]
LRVEGLGEQPRVYVQQGRATAFVGIPANARVGDYPVTISWPGGEVQGSLEVVHKQFTEDRLVVTEELSQTYYDPRQADEWARLFERRSHSFPRPLWDGSFMQPLDGPLDITTYFGEIRFVNGVETGRHSGMDFGAPEGTPIRAPAPGRVVLAETMIVTGLTITIDHGMNLYTTYYHCSRIDVQPGDWVETGQVIGLVGNTGFSLGPHLHWTATIGNTPVDPWPLIQSSPLGIRAVQPFTPD